PADKNHIGGPEPGAGNIISGNSVNGIDITVADTIVQGNLIGTDLTGTQALGNASFGIVVHAQASTIGGTTASARNIISGNSVGAQLTGGNNGSISFKGNYVGTDITGTVKLGNLSGVQASNGVII